MTNMAVTISAPDERILHLQIKGISGLICHNFSEKARKEMRDKQQQKAKGPRGAKDSDVEYEAAFYRFEDGGFGFPCSAFRAAAIRAGKMVDGLSMVDLRQMFFIQPDARDTTGIDCVQIHGTPEKREDVVRLKGGIADLRYRPEILDWSATLTISYDAGLISPEMIASLFYRAGYSVGVGDWRPEKNGDAGRFTIAEEVTSEVTDDEVDELKAVA